MSPVQTMLKLMIRRAGIGLTIGLGAFMFACTQGAGPTGEEAIPADVAQEIAEALDQGTVTDSTKTSAIEEEGAAETTGAGAEGGAAAEGAAAAGTEESEDEAAAKKAQAAKLMMIINSALF